MEANEAADPVEVDLFGAEAVMAGAEVLAELVEEFGWRRLPLPIDRIVPGRLEWIRMHPEILRPPKS